MRQIAQSIFKQNKKPASGMNRKEMRPVEEQWEKNCRWNRKRKISGGLALTIAALMTSTSVLPAMAVDFTGEAVQEAAAVEEIAVSVEAAEETPSEPAAESATETTEGRENTQVPEETAEPVAVEENGGIKDNSKTEENSEAGEAEKSDNTGVTVAIEESETAEEKIVIPVGNPNADLECAADWESTFADVSLTGDWGADTIAIAKTQLGYQESTSNFIAWLDENNQIVMRGYNRYAAWYHNGSSSYGDWCAMFCSFCYHYAGVPEDQMPEHSGVPAWITLLSNRGQYHGRTTGYTPKTGDLIFFDWESDGTSDHVALVEEVRDGHVYTIEGNYNNMVAEADYSLNDCRIMGYGELPVNPESVKPITQTTEAEVYQVTAEYTDEAALPENAVLQVIAIDAASQRYAAYAAEYEKITGKSMDFLLYVAFYADGTRVEPAVPVSVSISFDEKQAAASSELVFAEYGDDGLEKVENTGIDQNTEASFTLDSFCMVGGTLEEDVSYDLSEDGVLTISGSGALPEYCAPADVPWSSLKADIKKIVVEEGVTGIGRYAFYGCSNVTEVQLPSTLTDIGSYAFAGCSALPSVELPEGISDNEGKAFSECTSLTDVSNPDNAASSEKSDSRTVAVRSQVPDNIDSESSDHPATTDTSERTEDIASTSDADSQKKYCYTTVLFDGFNPLVSANQNTQKTDSGCQNQFCR